MENLEKKFDNVLSSDLIIHLIMIGAALASLTNVQEFFADTHDSTILAWALGLILGTVLVILSAKLAHMPMEWDNREYRIVAAATIFIGTISGSIQTWVYMKHLGLLWSAALGFGIPLGFEVGLAFAVASYKIKMRQVAGDAARNRLQDEIQKKLNDSIDEIDTDAMTDMFQSMANDVGSELANSLKAQMIHNIRNATPDFKVVHASAKTPPEPSRMLAEIPHISDISDCNVQESSVVSELNEARKEKMQGRVQECLNLLIGSGSLGISEIASALGVSPDTARRYCKELEASELAYNEDRKWHAALSMEVPQMTAA